MKEKSQYTEEFDKWFASLPLSLQKELDEAADIMAKHFADFIDNEIIDSYLKDNNVR